MRVLICLFLTVVFGRAGFPAPDPGTTGGGFQDTATAYIAKAELLNSPQSIFKFLKNKSDVKYTIGSFTITLLKKNGYALSEEVKGESLLKRHRDLLAKAGSGDTVKLEKITVTGPDGSRREFAPVTLIVR